jgi:hypothetical protein
MHTADLQLTYQPSAVQQPPEPSNHAPISSSSTASASAVGIAI